MKKWFAALGLVAALASSSLAAPTQWTIDPAHSTAEFAVTHLEVSDVEGTFNKITGSATITASIDMSSVDTGIQMRDDDLKSNDFFNVPAFPNMTFQTTKIWKTADATAKMTGNLTLHGITKEVTFDVKLPAPTAADRRTAEATTTISRKSFAVGPDSTLIGDDVSITLEIQLVKSPATPAR
jgi:polyisoprenoid-binding protein YceI